MDQTTKSIQSPEDIHPAIWRADQLARSVAKGVDTGHRILTNQLPERGWPMGNLVEILTQQNGIGEMRLLAPALAKVANRRIIMLQPPHPPQILGFAKLGLDPSKLVWVKSNSSAEANWACEQVLRSASCGAVLFWAQHIRPESLRRLHLAAQAGETLFFLLRPISAAQDASPAPLRLGVRPAPGGLNITFIKRRGPIREEPLFLPLTTVTKPRTRRVLPAITPAPAEINLPDFSASN